MKKLSLLLLAVTFCIATSATVDFDDYIVVNNQKTACKKLNVKTNVVHIICENGLERTFTKKEISEYSKRGKIYVKLPVYENQEITDESRFMELIRDIDGYRLYRTNSFTQQSPVRIMDCYYVYKNDKFLFHTTPDNAERTLKFFNVRLVTIN